MGPPGKTARTVTKIKGLITSDMDVVDIGSIRDLKKILAISGNRSSGHKLLLSNLHPLIPNVDVKLAEASIQKAILVFS
jgi:hypothetical protein|tara:strand:+ start:354 stop:590 length:237 start_codon:yes stop_codon:yes gene_type:complete